MTKSVEERHRSHCCPSVLAAPLEQEAGDLAPRSRRWPTRYGCACSASWPTRARSAPATSWSRSARSQPTVSHHTKILAEAGLITGEKRGRWVWWRIVPERLDALRDGLEHRVPAPR